MVDAALVAIIDRYRQDGYVPLNALNSALPDTTTVEDIERAYAAIESFGLYVLDEGEDAPNVRFGSAAKEHGEDQAQLRRQALLALLASRIGLNEIVDLGERLRKGKIHAHNVFDEIPAGKIVDDDESRRVEHALWHIDRIRKLARDIAKVKETLAAKKLNEVKRKALRADIQAVEGQMVVELEAIQLNKKQIDRIVLKLKGLIKRVEEAERELLDCERRVDVPVRELKRLLRDARTDEREKKKLAKKLRLSCEGMEDLDRVVRTAIRKIMRVQEEATLPVEELRRTFGIIELWHERLMQQPAHAVNSAGGRSLLLTKTPAPGRVLLADLRALEARVVTLANEVALSTAIPTSRSRVGRPPAAQSRAVAFGSRRGAASTSTPSEAGTYADLGGVGESLIFAIMRPRWEAAARADAERTRTLLWSIASRYWAFDSSAEQDLRRSLDAGPETWLDSECVRCLLWPSKTLYGDAMGFDLFGMNDAHDDWLCLEVKTTQGPLATQFEMTVNEYERARAEGQRYVIVRVSRIHAELPDVRFWHDPAALIEAGAFELTPASFRVSLTSRP